MDRRELEGGDVSVLREPFELVQLVYPDPNGFLPYEAGFDQRRIASQPLIGTLDG